MLVFIFIAVYENVFNLVFIKDNTDMCIEVLK